MQPINKIELMYNTVAKEWAKAFANEHESKPMDKEILLKFAELVKDKSLVWDLGCGPGCTTKFLSDLGLKISGLDLSENLIFEASKSFPVINFVKGNMLQLDFDDDSLAGVVSFYSIVHFTKEQVEVAFNEIYRRIQPGGVLLFTFHIGSETIHVDEFLGKNVDIDFMFFETDFIKELLQKTGFKKIEITEREPYPDVEYQSRRAYVFAYKT